MSETETESYTNRVEQAEQLSHELMEVQTATTTEGHVRATVTEIVRNPSGYESGIVVRAETPFGKFVSQHFDPPEPWTDEKAFVRWVQDNGGAAGALGELVGADVAVSGEEFVVPDEPRSLSERIIDNMDSVVFFGMGIIGAILFTAGMGFYLGDIFDYSITVSLTIALGALFTAPLGAFFGLMSGVLMVEDILGWEPPE